MTKIDFLCLAPLMIIAAAPVIIMLLIIISRNLRIIYGFSLFMFILAFVSLIPVMPHATHFVGPLLVFDGYGILFLGIIFFSAILITVLSYDYLSRQGGDREEYFLILFVAVLGASVLVVSEHFISFFLGLETLSISLYVLTAYIKSRDFCIEAGVKFLVIASVTTAFLLFGMGLVYAETGTMSFRSFTLNSPGINPFSPLLLTGTGLMLAGIGFKLALVPFHMWTPDVYQGAPVPVTVFIATISKGAVLALALRLFIDIGGYDNRSLVIIVSGISIISMFTGNLLALRQANLKRMLAYSSIAHLGYLLVTLLAGRENGVEAAIFYITAYTITSLGAFGTISILSGSSRDAEELTDVKGLFWTNPLMAIVMTLSLLSLAGIPLTAGFISKFYLALAGIKSGLFLLVIILIINSVLSLYFYLRVVRSMFAEPDLRQGFRLNLASGFVLLITAAGIIFLGVMPSVISRLINTFSSLN